LPSNGICVGISSSTIEDPRPAPQYGLAVHPDFEGGEGPIPVGTYGHVVPLTGPITYPHRDPIPVGAADLLIQYWQFFPRSDSQAPVFGDHDGDWLYLDVYVKRFALEHPNELMMIWGLSCTIITAMTIVTPTFYLGPTVSN
jgi:hypothetical protein